MSAPPSGTNAGRRLLPTPPYPSSPRRTRIKTISSCVEHPPTHTVRIHLSPLARVVPREDRLHDDLVPLVTGEFIQLFFGSLQPDHRCPLSRPGARIVKRHFILDLVRRGALKTLDQVKVFRHPKRIELRLKIRRIHHQRVALPPAARISRPAPDLVRKVRSSIHGNDPRLVNVFRKQKHVIPRLYDLVVPMQPRAV